MDEQQRQEFARRVREARAARGWNQVQLAEAAHIAPNTVGSIELGKRSPQPQSIAAVIEALDLEPVSDVEALPADVALVAQLVTMWMLGIPQEDRARAVLDLVQFLGTPPETDDPAPVLDRTPGRGRGKASDMRKMPTLNELGP